jgi:hypothetical protein
MHVGTPDHTQAEDRRRLRKERSLDTIAQAVTGRGLEAVGVRMDLLKG